MIRSEEGDKAREAEEVEQIVDLKPTFWSAREANEVAEASQDDGSSTKGPSAGLKTYEVSADIVGLRNRRAPCPTSRSDELNFGDDI